MSTTLAQLLNIKYPIFQAPMAGGLVTADFVAQVSNFGMLGAVPSGYLSLAQTSEFITEVKQRTDKPFSLNIFVDYTKYAETPINKPEEIISIERNYDEHASSTFSITPPPSVDELIQLAIQHTIPVLSTTFGLLSTPHVTALKLAGIKIMTTINSVYELELSIKTQQPDILVYQNSLAGGHKGGFTSLPHSEEAAILEAIQRHNNVKCVLAGGIVNKKDINTALAKGFDGVQIGSAFLATQESSANQVYKTAILQNTETAFTTSITGRSARGLKNKIAGLDLKENLGFPYMHYATSSLRKLAKQHEDANFQSLWCGAGIARINTIPSLQHYMKSLIS